MTNELIRESDRNVEASDRDRYARPEQTLEPVYGYPYELFATTIGGQQTRSCFRNTTDRDASALEYLSVGFTVVFRTNELAY